MKSSVVMSRALPDFLWIPRRSEGRWIWGKAWKHIQVIENYGDMRFQFGRFTSHVTYTRRG